MYMHARVVSSIGYTDLARSPLLPKVGLSFQNKLKKCINWLIKQQMQYNNPSYKHADCLKIILEIIVM